MPNSLISNDTDAPSHGRGRRFNPYSAHHFYNAKSITYRNGSGQPFPFDWHLHAEQSMKRRAVPCKIRAVR
jgi:hypothetical protein